MKTFQAKLMQALQLYLLILWVIFPYSTIEILPNEAHKIENSKHLSKTWEIPVKIVSLGTQYCPFCISVTEISLFRSI